MIRKISFLSPPSISVLSDWYSLCHFNSLCQTPSWIFVKENLYDCWMCFYGPVFWIMYMFTCSSELHRANRDSSIDVMTFLPTGSDLLDDNNDDYDQSLKSGSNGGHSIFNSDKYAKSHTAVRKTKSNNDEDLRSIRSSKSFRRTLKVHLRAIRQKQQSLNDVMRRSLLRRASKIPLIQAPLSFNHSDRHSITVVKPSTSLPTHALSESPPPPSSSSSPFKRLSLSSSPSPTANQSPYNNNNSKMKYIHPLTLDRRVSLSDSLLKSISMKRKRTTFSNSAASVVAPSSKHFSNSDFMDHDDCEESVCLSHPLLSSSTSPLPKPSSSNRRKTTPEISRDRRNNE